ncbi:MAG: hypothetical protein ACI8TQ_004106 [Planctomycetota bacterium]|jgi:hypothetical protein
MERECSLSESDGKMGPGRSRGPFFSVAAKSARKDVKHLDLALPDDLAQLV